MEKLLQAVVKGQEGVADGKEREDLITRYLEGQNGPTACERMVDVLCQIDDNADKSADNSLPKKLERWLVTRGLHAAKAVKSSLPGSHNKPEFQKHRFPAIVLDDVRRKVDRFQGLLGDRSGTDPIQIEQVNEVMFQLHSGAGIGAPRIEI